MSDTNHPVYDHGLRVTAQEGDTNVLHEVTEALRRAGHPTPEHWLNSPQAQEAQGKSPEVQRMLINDFWRQELLNLKPSITQIERYCLSVDDELSDYVKHFEKVVAPRLIEFGLAKPKN